MRQDHAGMSRAAGGSMPAPQRRPPARAMRSAPPGLERHVVVIDAVTEKLKARKMKDKIRRTFVRVGGRHVLHLMIGKPGANVATAVVGRY